MNEKKVVPFPIPGVSFSEAWVIVKQSLEDDSVPIQKKVLAIKRISEMETLNSITKDDLVKALRWLFEHYDFER